MKFIIDIIKNLFKKNRKPSNTSSIPFEGMVDGRHSQHKKDLEKLKNSQEKYKNNVHKKEELPYKATKSLLTKTELKFFQQLKKELPNDYYVSVKPRLLDVVYLPKNTKNYQIYFNKISQKHVDFLICDKQNMCPLMVIELDDYSHEREDRQIRDAFVDEVLKSGNVLVSHIKVNNEYSTEFTEVINRLR